VGTAGSGVGGAGGGGGVVVGAGLFSGCGAGCGAGCGWLGFVVEAGGTAVAGAAVLTEIGVTVAGTAVLPVGMSVGVSVGPPGVTVDVGTATPITCTLTELESLPPALATFEITVPPGVVDFTRTWIVTDAGFTSLTVSEQLTDWPDEQLPEPELAPSTSRLLSSESVIVTDVSVVLVVITEML
jgi:hypothetical protein